MVKAFKATNREKKFFLAIRQYNKPKLIIRVELGNDNMYHYGLRTSNRYLRFCDFVIYANFECKTNTVQGWLFAKSLVETQFFLSFWPKWLNPWKILTKKRNQTSKVRSRNEWTLLLTRSYFHFHSITSVVITIKIY